MYFQTLVELKRYVDGIAVSADEQLMILVGDKSAAAVSEMSEYLNQKSIRFFGGICAGLLVGDRNRSEGFIIQKLKPVYSSVVLPFMMRFKFNFEAGKDYTALVLVDGLSSKMKELTDTVYDKLGSQVKYVGGGAGYYDLVHRPCVFDNKGIYKDVLYICILEADVKLAVKHGWNRLEGPFFVKKSRDNVLCQLENDSAFEVYKHVIEDVERITLFKEDFFQYAKDHPFGIVEEDGSVVVRDPIALNDDNEIICVASIPEGSDVYVLKGDADTLLNSSLQIAEYCAENAPERYLPLLFDCISRAMFLEQRFDEELRNIQNKLRFPLEGALSIGEIAFKRNGQLVIHNKSTVLALVEA